MDEVKPRDIRCHTHVMAIIYIPVYMGDNTVGDDDGTSRTPLIALPCTTLYFRALPCLAL